MVHMFLYIICEWGILIRYGILYDKFLGMKLALKMKRLIIGMIGFSLVTGASYILYYEYTEHVSILVTAVMIGLAFRNEKKKALFAYLPLYIFSSFMDEFGATVWGKMSHFNPLIVIEREGVIYNICIVFVTIAILLICEMFMKEKKVFQRIVASIDAKSYILIVASLFSLTMLMSMVTFCLFVDETNQVFIRNIEKILFFVIASVLSGFLVIGNLVALVTKYKIQIEVIEAYKKKNEMESKYYQMLKQKNEEIRGFRHDFHFHIEYLRQQIEENNYEEVRTHIQELVDVDKNTVQKNKVFSGNSVIDAIIYGTVFEYGNQDIVFHYKGKMKEDIGIRDIDLITLLSNALENAVEACKMCETEKIIWLHVAQHKENIQFIVENTFKEFGSRSKERRFTSKKDSGLHGYGRLNMRQVAEKYDGVLEEEIVKGKYRVYIQLNGKREEKY